MATPRVPALDRRSIQMVIYSSTDLHSLCLFRLTCSFVVSSRITYLSGCALSNEMGKSDKTFKLVDHNFFEIILTSKTSLRTKACI